MNAEKSKPARRTKPIEPPKVLPESLLAARRPAWLTREELERLSPEALRDVEELVLSVYQELVLEAATALEKAAGEQLVFMVWLELLQTVRLSGELTKSRLMRIGSDVNVDHEINWYMHLGAQKLKVANFLLRAKEARERWQAKREARESAGSGGAAAAPATGVPLSAPAARSLSNGRRTSVPAEEPHADELAERNFSGCEHSGVETSSERGPTTEVTQAAPVMLSRGLENGEFGKTET